MTFIGRRRVSGSRFAAFVCLRGASSRLTAGGRPASATACRLIRPRLRMRWTGYLIAWTPWRRFRSQSLPAPGSNDSASSEPGRRNQHTFGRAQILGPPSAGVRERPSSETRAGVPARRYLRSKSRCSPRRCLAVAPGRMLPSRRPLSLLRHPAGLATAFSQSPGGCGGVQTLEIGDAPEVRPPDAGSESSGGPQPRRSSELCGRVRGRRFGVRSMS